MRKYYSIVCDYFLTIFLSENFFLVILHSYNTLYICCFSEMVTIDRYCHDRFIELLPVLDVDNSASIQDIADMWPAFQDILASFTNLK